MKTRILFLTVLAWGCGRSAVAQVPDNLVVEGVPAIPPELRVQVAPYLEFRTATFNSWHPTRREMLVTTRFADAPQLHLVRMPLGARRQLTFQPEPVAGGSFQPAGGDSIVFARDTGGGEFYQLYQLNVASGAITLLTDGKSRNSAPRWAHDGHRFAYTSTRRNGRDTDVYLMDPARPDSNRCLLELTGGGWTVADWSSDDSRLLLIEGLSINDSRLWLVDVASAAKARLTPESADPIAWGPARFARDGKSIFVATDRDAEFKRLCRMDLTSKSLTAITPAAIGGVTELDLSDDGATLAFVANESGRSVLHLWDVSAGRDLPSPELPQGVIATLKWHKNSRDLAFNLDSARSPNDVHVLDAKTGMVERWTESETGGLNPQSFVEPHLVNIKSFDGTTIPAFVYRPDPRKFPGPRPVIVSLHGGPESQSRPVFQARNNFYLNELGVALVYPNVRGSDGYGKSFLALDNGFKREDSVKDVGATLDWIGTQNDFAPQRVAVMGGSYGGYMVLASMIHFNDRLRCGIDVVGISNFLSFLKNTQDYRRDLRRVEYGDERVPAMAEFLARISPTARAAEIKKPLFVVQGFNDPRVPVTEAEQMVKAIRDHGGNAWYLMARDEGHGFKNKRNADFFYLGTILFLKQHLLNGDAASPGSPQ
jgi:dipeptidyl aminopeptidase/acylaminoacyl peptidase